MRSASRLAHRVTADLELFRERFFANAIARFVPAVRNRWEDAVGDLLRKRLQFPQHDLLAVVLFNALFNSACQHPICNHGISHRNVVVFPTTAPAPPA